jgi:hypothetical protein
LLYQRQQIPDQMDSLKRATSSQQQRHQQTSSNENVTNGDARAMREEMRRRREMMRHKKLEQRFLKKASSTVETFDRLVKILKDDILSSTDSPTEEIAIVFGATPVRI